MVTLEVLLRSDAANSNGFGKYKPQVPVLCLDFVGIVSYSPNMGKLTELTDKLAVQMALSEFQELGRNGFLSKYSLKASRDYFVEHDGQWVDSKPLLSVAYGYQFPNHGPLAVESFRGGVGGVLQALERLGMTAMTPTQICPPQLGDSFANRTAVYEAFGGNKVSGIIRFPGDSVVNIFSDAQGPYSDDAPSTTHTFGYRGEGLNGPQRVEKAGNAYLEEARIEGQAARYWYRPQGGNFSFVTWVAVLGRAWVDGIGQDKLPRPEIEWVLQAVPAADSSAWPQEVRSAWEELRSAGTGTSTSPEAQPKSSYSDLVQRVENRGQKRRTSGVVRADYPRSAAARRAVLLRSEGQCEGWCCTGMPAELNRQGNPILDVDHIKDLALGGLDHPENMVALCPNCHASKTRTSRTAKWRQELSKIAVAAHKLSLAVELTSQSSSTPL